MTHTDLIEKLSKLDGPCRVTDMLIFCDTAESNFEYHGGDSVLAVTGGFSARVEIEYIPKFTASIDAALTLVPEGWTRCVIQIGAAYLDGVYKAENGIRVRHEISSGGGPYVDSFHNSLPIAITIASLRAIEATKGE